MSRRERARLVALEAAGGIYCWKHATRCPASHQAVLREIQWSYRPGDDVTVARKFDEQLDATMSGKVEHLGGAWIVQSGEYEDRYIVLVAASLDAAVAGIKALYGAPYVVEWSEVEPASLRVDVWRVRGKFEQVARYSTRHDSWYDIERWNLEGR